MLELLSPLTVERADQEFCGSSCFSCCGRLGRSRFLRRDPSRFCLGSEALFLGDSAVD